MIPVLFLPDRLFGVQYALTTPFGAAILDTAIL